MTLEHGVAAIFPQMEKIVEMLLPEGYLPIQPTAPGTTPASQTPPSDGETQLAARTIESTNPRSLTSPDAPRPTSRMLGPACALRILARNSKCYPPSCGHVGTDVTMYYSRGAAGPYTRHRAIRQSETLVSFWNAPPGGRHVGVARQDSKPK